MTHVKIIWISWQLLSCTISCWVLHYVKNPFRYDSHCAIILSIGTLKCKCTSKNVDVSRVQNQKIECPEWKLLHFMLSAYCTYFHADLIIQSSQLPTELRCELIQQTIDLCNKQVASNKPKSGKRLVFNLAVSFCSLASWSWKFGAYSRREPLLLWSWNVIRPICHVKMRTLATSIVLITVQMLLLAVPWRMKNLLHCWRATT